MDRLTGSSFMLKCLWNGNRKGPSHRNSRLRCWQLSCCLKQFTGFWSFGPAGPPLRLVHFQMLNSLCVLTRRHHKCRLEGTIEDGGTEGWRITQVNRTLFALWGHFSSSLAPTSRRNRSGCIAPYKCTAMWVPSAVERVIDHLITQHL